MEQRSSILHRCNPQTMVLHLAGVKKKTFLIVGLKYYVQNRISLSDVKYILYKMSTNLFCSLASIKDEGLDHVFRMNVSD